MNRINTAVYTLALAAALMGCQTDSVLFVTKTSLSIVEADSKPPGISIAYDRIEGYLGPTSESGEAPPVLGYFGSDGNIFMPKVQQVYATGNAARILVGKDPKCTPKKIDDPNRVMFFGTSTTTGLKVGFIPNAPVPDSFVLGWRRKEFSQIPLMTATEDLNCDDATGSIAKGQKYYPATLASVNNATSVPRAGVEGVTQQHQQYFATGDAAVGLAGMQEVQGLIHTLNKGVFDDYYAADQAQKDEAVVLAGCYAGLLPTQRPKVWDEASQFGLFQDGADEDTRKLLDDEFSGAIDAQGNIIAPARLAKADRIYVKSVVTAPGGNDPARARLLAIHRRTVCDLSALNI